MERKSRLNRRILKRLPLLVSAMLLTGCASLPKHRDIACTRSAAPLVLSVDGGKTFTTTLDVLTYNVEGLPWPARSGRAGQLKQIGAILNALREEGKGPDLVLFQEVFSKAAVRSVESVAYPALAGGPSRTGRSTLGSDIALPGKPRPLKGEIGIRLMSSGLVIASRYPIVERQSAAFSRKSCAGVDCLANKGVQLARIAIPGVPEPIDIFNTHMNAQSASRVKPERHLTSHIAQSLELRQFLLNNWDQAHPAIFGGDFNMRQAPSRFEPFVALQPLDLVHHYCVDEGNGCDVRMSWDGDEPWLDTQDLQLFVSGSNVRVTPVMVQSLFDGSEGSPALSDHDGLLVRYRLTWASEPAASSAACPASRTAPTATQALRPIR